MAVLYQVFNDTLLIITCVSQLNIYPKALYSISASYSKIYVTLLKEISFVTKGCIITSRLKK